MARKKNEPSQAAKLFQMVEILRSQPHGVPHHEMAAEVKLTERQVRRNYKELRECGFEVKNVLLNRRGAGKLLGQNRQTITLTRRECFALLCSRRMHEVMEGTPLYEDLDSVCDKALRSLPLEEREDALKLGERFRYIPDGGVKSYEGKQDVIDALQTSVMEGRVVEYTYRQARGVPQKGFLAVYRMVLHRHGLYVLAARVKKPVKGETIPPNTGKEPGLFAVERFVEADCLRGTRFKFPDHVDLDRYFQGAFGVRIGGGTRDPQRVVIHFNKARATNVLARTWHPTQTISRSRKGTVRLELWLTDLKEAVSWILSWGPQAKAVHPPELVELVHDELMGAARLYRRFRRDRKARMAGTPEG